MRQAQLFLLLIVIFAIKGIGCTALSGVKSFAGSSANPEREIE